jgi:hypothetical protein
LKKKENLSVSILHEQASILELSPGFLIMKQQRVKC